LHGFLKLKTPVFHKKQTAKVLIAKTATARDRRVSVCGVAVAKENDAAKRRRSSVKSDVDGGGSSSTLPRYSTDEPLHYHQMIKSDTPGTRRMKRHMDKIS